MKSPKLKTLIIIPVIVFAAFYTLGAALIASKETPNLDYAAPPSAPLNIAIFGASGTAGDGILKAALASPYIDTISVITRRSTPRIEQGVESGKVTMIKHMDYLDYSSISEEFASIDTVFWAIGISSVGMDRTPYRRIHVSFPMAFVQAWDEVSEIPDTTFHYISSSDISEDSSAMWVQEKILAEKSLFEFANNRSMNVIAYRPDYIKPTAEEVHLGQSLLYWFFRPLGAAVKASEVGNAMIESSIRKYTNGKKINTFGILRHHQTYNHRIQSTVGK